MPSRSTLRLVGPSGCGRSSAGWLSMADRPYSRLYLSVMDDPKFDGIREDVRLFGSWALLLVIADGAYPAPAYCPPMVSKGALRRLADAGLVDVLTGGRYRMHGLANEREMRSQRARDAAALRWHSGRNADPMLDETRRDKTRQDERPLPPSRRRRGTGTSPRETGANPRANGTSPRQERQQQKTGPTVLGEIMRRAQEAGR